MEAMDASPASMPATAAVDRSLVIRNLRKEYRAGQPVLKDVSLTVQGRGMTAIIGPSGTGKSTLIRCINRLVDPTSGEILFRGQDLARLRGRELRMARRRIGMVFQEYNLVERLSVIENVLTGRLGYIAVWRAWLRRFTPQDIDRAFRLLDAVGLGELATQRADQLSGGQRQRVGIARALMQEPDLVLADEPTSSLDPKTSVEIMELIASRAGERDIPVIVNIHNVDLARRFADRIIGMSRGDIVFDGPPQALEDRHLMEIYGGEGWLE
jgi:phosphonate transport system ATP-binding protein